MKRSAFVRAWLSTIRDRELTIKRSIEKWQEKYPPAVAVQAIADRPRVSTRGIVRVPTRKDLDRRKQSLYFGEDMLSEMRQEAERQGRPISWLLQKAWRYSAERIRNFPAPHLEIE